MENVLRKYVSWRTHELVSQILVLGSLVDGIGNEQSQTSNIHPCPGARRPGKPPDAEDFLQQSASPGWTQRIK